MLAEYRRDIELYHRDLERQLNSHEVKQAIKAIGAAHPILKKYPTPEDLTALVQPGKQNYADKDKILGILLSVLKQDTTIFPLLNLMFWDNLMRLFQSKRQIIPNPEELFSRIQLDFFHTAVTYPLERRPKKIDVNLILDTKKKVTRWQKQEAVYYARHEELNPDYDPAQSLAELQTSQVFPKEMEAYLLDLVYRKIIKEQQYDLLLETQVYKRMSQKEWAKTRGVSYTATRSRRFRVEASIREYEESQRKKIE